MSLFPYKWYLKDGYPANGINLHNKNKPHYLIGMSTPPVMMAQISYRIYEQILSKI